MTLSAASDRRKPAASQRADGPAPASSSHADATSVSAAVSTSPTSAEASDLDATKPRGETRVSSLSQPPEARAHRSAKPSARAASGSTAARVAATSRERHRRSAWCSTAAAASSARSHSPSSHARAARSACAASEAARPPAMPTRPKELARRANEPEGSEEHQRGGHLHLRAAEQRLRRARRVADGEARRRRADGVAVREAPRRLRLAHRARGRGDVRGGRRRNGTFPGEKRASASSPRGSRRFAVSVARAPAARAAAASIFILPATLSGGSGERDASAFPLAPPRGERREFPGGSRGSERLRRSRGNTGLAEIRRGAPRAARRRRLRRGTRRREPAGVRHARHGEGVVLASRRRQRGGGVGGPARHQEHPRRLLGVAALARDGLRAPRRHVGPVRQGHRGRGGDGGVPVAHLHARLAVRREVTQAKPNVGARASASASLIPRPRRRRSPPAPRAEPGFAKAASASAASARARRRARASQTCGVTTAPAASSAGPRASPSPTASMRARRHSSSAEAYPESAAKSASCLWHAEGAAAARRATAPPPIAAPANERERDWTSRRDSASGPAGLSSDPPASLASLSGRSPSPCPRDTPNPAAPPTAGAAVTSAPITARSFAEGTIRSVLQKRMVESREHVTARNGRSRCVPMS